MQCSLKLLQTGLMVIKLSMNDFCPHTRKIANQNTVSNMKCSDWMILECALKKMVLKFLMTVRSGVSTQSRYTSAIQYLEFFTGKLATSY